MKAFKIVIIFVCLSLHLQNYVESKLSVEVFKQRIYDFCQKDHPFSDRFIRLQKHWRFHLNKESREMWDKAEERMKDTTNFVKNYEFFYALHESFIEAILASPEPKKQIFLDTLRECLKKLIDTHSERWEKMFYKKLYERVVAKTFLTYDFKCDGMYTDLLFYMFRDRNVAHNDVHYKIFKMKDSEEYFVAFNSRKLSYCDFIQYENVPKSINCTQNTESAVITEDSRYYFVHNLNSEYLTQLLYNCGAENFSISAEKNMTYYYVGAGRSGKMQIRFAAVLHLSILLMWIV